MRHDLIGQRFGILTVFAPTQRALSSGRKMPAWVMRCDCGTERVCMTVNLMKGRHRSCGCQRTQLMQKATRTIPRTSVGKHIPEYSVWSQMRQRCSKPYAPNYEFYGAKGIMVCSRWDQGESGKSGFECFLADMGPRPFDGASIDRVDPKGNYEPGNCRWADSDTQHNNKRNNVVLEYEGKRMTVTQWADHLGVKQSLIAQRLKRGWPVEAVLTPPLKTWSRHRSNHDMAVR